MQILEGQTKSITVFLILANIMCDKLRLQDVILAL